MSYRSDNALVSTLTATGAGAEIGVPIFSVSALSASNTTLKTYENVFSLKKRGSKLEKAIHFMNLLNKSQWPHVFFIKKSYENECESKKFLSWETRRLNRTKTLIENVFEDVLNKVISTRENIQNLIGFTSNELKTFAFVSFSLHKREDLNRSVSSSIVTSGEICLYVTENTKLVCVRITF